MTAQILVVGDGIEGLATALCARESGFDVTVIGSATPTDEYALVELTPSAVKVLRALGLRDALNETGTVTETHQLRSWRTSYLIALLPLGAATHQRYGAPHYHLRSNDLRQLLLAQLNARTEHRPDCHLVELRHLAAGIEVDLRTDQRTSREHFAAVIAADGPTSATRKILFGPQDVGRTGTMKWVAEITNQQLPPLFTNPQHLTTWLGPGTSIRHGASSGRVYLSGIVPERSRATSDNSPASNTESGASAHPGAAALASWNVALQPLIANGTRADTKTRLEPVLSYPESGQWSRGAATLMGSAAHPFIATAANDIPTSLALEDAWVLGRMLEYYDDELDKAFTEFQRYRRPRAQRAGAHLLRVQEELHLGDGAPAWRRNFRQALATRFLPDIAIAKFDWLYGYEAIRGFE